MPRSRSPKRWPLLGALLGTGATLALVLGFGALAGAGAAAGTAAPTNTSPPTLSGTPQQGHTLSGSKGSWSGSPTDYNYFWRRCDKDGGSCADIGGATAVSYTLTSSDVGHTIRFRVEAKNADGSTFASSVPSAVITAATPAAPTNTSPPTLRGTPQQGHTLSGSKGSWSGSPTDYNYFWRRCDRDGGGCADISGAHGATYTLTAGDVGHTIRFRVEARNAGGSTFASSVPSAVIAAAGKPANTALPRISGTAQQGEKLTGFRGSWSGNPTDYNYFWTRCNRSGGSCSDISGATASTYTLGSADVGNTIRFKVEATNAGGSTFASSAQTPVVAPAAPPPPATGCPSGSGPVRVTNVGAPARLLIDQQQTSPTVVTRGTRQLTIRYHVTACGGRPVQGALVYATAVPYNQLSIPPEQLTDSNGWATLNFTMLSGYPVSSKQQLIAVFARARKPGENLLAGISTRRLFSVTVNLHS